MKHNFLLIIFLILILTNNSLNGQVLSLSDIEVIQPNCHDSINGSIKFTVLGGIPPYTYDWSNGKKTPFLNKLKEGTYSVTVTDNSTPKVQISQKFQITNPPKMELFWHYDCFSTQAHLLVIDSTSWDVKYPIEIRRIPEFGIQGNSRNHSINPNFCKMYPDSGDCKFYPSRHIYETTFNPYDSLTLRLVSLTKGYCAADYKFTKPTFDKPKYRVDAKPDTLYVPQNKAVDATLSFNIFDSSEPLKDIKWYRIEGNNANISYEDYKNSKVDCYQCHTISLIENKPSIYRLRVEGRFGCIALDDVYVIAKEGFDKDFIPAYLPTAFSPNDDGTNDYFTAFSGGEVLKIISMDIFDRWGNHIFETKDIEPNVEYLGWNGRKRGVDVPQGNYTYAFRLLPKDGTEKTAKGEVMLIR